ncbi:hypothetical protein A3Q56_07152, partial [Intoshia linei]
VDRSGAYAARWIAKSLVKEKLCRRVLVQISYAIGISEPLAIFVDSYDTSMKDDSELVEIIKNNFDLRPGAIAEELKLDKPIYQTTAVYGHFGRSEDIGNYYYGQNHPMKPHRIRMAHNLILNYGLYQNLEVYRPMKASAESIGAFHSDEYVKFLQNIKPDNMPENSKQMMRFNVGEDCPVFTGLYEFCQISAGSSLAAAYNINKGISDIGINWMGGLHHSKKSEASGFCYINDIVLAILELLKCHKRVLYIDIDIHHGDGVEEAFYVTDRVMTVSFHKYGEYFPGTGDLRDIGAGPGKNYSLNFPLHDGIDDESYEKIFVPVINKVVEFYQPEAIVLQCGADSLTGDRLGCFNITLKGHGKCVEFVTKLNLPMLILGGGGYTIRNVARCWAYETAVALDVEISNELPYNDYFEYYGPDFKLHITPSNMSNQNNPDYLRKVTEQLCENMKNIMHAPNVEMKQIPTDHFDPSIEKDLDEEANADSRNSQFTQDRHVSRDDVLSIPEIENSNRIADELMLPMAKKARMSVSIMNKKQTVPDEEIESICSDISTEKEEFDELEPKKDDPMHIKDCESIDNTEKSDENTA